MPLLCCKRSDDASAAAGSAASASASASPAAEGREEWSSRLAFYFAAVGSAVGFGNVWRFPSLVYEYGGGAFFIPYVAAAVLVGIPILVLEIALGQYYQTGDVGVFGSIHSRLRGVGLSSVACGYMLVVYYSMLLSWVLHAFFDSFGDNFWAHSDVTGKAAKDYFFNDIIGMTTLTSTYRPTRLVGPNVGYSLLTWILVYLCVAWGLKWTGRITYFTMGFPVVLLFIFVGRSATLPGAQDGIYEYVGHSNWEVFTETPDVWAKAVAQIFFSLSVTFGIMTAYGSHCKPGEPALLNSCVIATSNCMFSFVAGFAVFATLGYSAQLEGIDDITKLEYKTFGLVFGTWPVALGTLPGGEHWIRLFFVMLFLLGIDSAFSFVEGFLTVLHDTVLFHDKKRWALCLGLSVVAFLLSLIYATDAGLLFLDAIDYYINFVMLLVGGFECFAAGWIYNIEGQIELLGPWVVFTYMGTTFGSVIVACIVWFSTTPASTAIWAGFVALAAFYAIGMSGVFLLMRRRQVVEPNATWSALFMKNVTDLSRDLSQACGWLPWAWGFLIKHFIPPVILVLFSLDASTKNDDGKTKFGNYEGYPNWPYQVLGLLCVVFTGFLFVSSAVFPGMYAGFQMTKDAEERVFKKESGDDGGKDEGVFPENAAPEESPEETEMKNEDAAKGEEEGEGVEAPLAAVEAEVSEKAKEEEEVVA